MPIIDREAIELETLRAEVAISNLLVKEKQERNKVYKPIREYMGRYLVMIGGSASGKSYEAADKVLDRIVHETKENIGQAHRILCIRNERKQITESQFPLLKARALLRYPDLPWVFNVGQGNERIKLFGNELLFAGLDDVEKLKSIFDITSIWIEEADQVLHKDLRELDRRLRGYDGYMQIMLSFNPVSITSWIKGRFFDGKDDKTVCLRGKAIFEDFTRYDKADESIDLSKKITVIDPDTGDEEEIYYYNTVILHTTFLDNKFLKYSDRQVLRDMEKHDKNEYNVYALGQWGIVGGIYFDKYNINERRVIMDKYIAENGLTRGYFFFEYLNHVIIDDTIKWVDDAFGDIRIYEEPRIHTPYVIGADTAGDGSDKNAALCMNNITEHDVASVHMSGDEDLYARQLYCLGKYYGLLNECPNNALMAIETNFSSHPMKEILRMGYDNMYTQKGDPDSYVGGTPKKHGFNTNKKTRPLMLDSLRVIVRESPENIRDIVFIKEANTFARNDKGKPEAMLGQHDDMVMASAICRYCRDDQYTNEAQAYADYDLTTLRADYYEDYMSSPEEVKPMLLKRYVDRGLLKPREEFWKN
jgi:phage terminase large subunit